MKYLGEMDLYKGIVLGSLLLMPVAGWWLMGIEEQITQGEIALRREQGRNSYLVEIGELMGKYEKIERGKVNEQNLEDIAREHRTFFQQVIMKRSLADGGAGSAFQPGDFEFAPDQPRGAGRNVEDVVVKINFKGDRQVLPRRFIYALIYNVEMTAPVWRLRSLSIQNEEASEFRNEPPPLPLKDEWKVLDISFARRQPREEGD